MASYQSDQATQGSHRFSYHPRPAENPSMSRTRSHLYTCNTADPVNATLAGAGAGACARPRDHSTLIRTVDRALAGNHTSGNAAVTGTTGDGRGPSSATTDDSVRGVGARFGGSQ